MTGRKSERPNPFGLGLLCDCGLLPPLRGRDALPITMLIYFELVEKTGWLSLGNVLAIITAVGVLVAGLAAWCQLRTMSRQMLATTLLALDERWESDAFKPARDELQKLTKRINDEIQKANPRVPPEDWMDMAASMYPERLSQLEGASPETYGQLLRVCGFFETVGLAARREYIALEDIVELLQEDRFRRLAKYLKITFGNCRNQKVRRGFSSTVFGSSTRLGDCLSAKALFEPITKRAIRAC